LSALRVACASMTIGVHGMHQLMEPLSEL
jgi:hypothetical protein